MPELITFNRWVANPELSLQALAEGGKRLHAGSLEVERSDRPGGKAISPKERERAIQALRDVADVLELHEVFCALFEAEEIVGTLSIENLDRDQIRRATAVVRDLTGLDLSEVMNRADRFMPPETPDAEAEKSAPRVPPDLESALTRMAGSLLSTNINQIEEVALTYGRNSLGHRCRIAYQWLRSFVFRRGSEQGKQVRAAGQAYAERRLSLVEVAGVLGVPVDEAIRLLEQYGYSRSVGRIKLDSDSRKARLAKLRDDRIARKDQPRLDPTLVLRDVVASHRIEDLDARPWLPTIPKT